MAIDLKPILRVKATNTRLIIAVFAVMIALIAYFVSSSYYNAITKSKAEILARLKAIAFTSVWLIDGDKHDSLANNLMAKDAIVGNEENKIYKQLHTTLKAVHQTNQLESPLYTIVYYERDSTFHFIVTSADQPYYRHSYKNYPKELLKNYQMGGVLDSYHDENGKWLSAFAPLKNSKGEVIALLEADENFESFIAQAQKDLVQNALVSLAVVLPFGILLFGYLSYTLKKQAEDQEMLMHQKEEIESQNEEIKTQSDFIEKQNKELDLRVKDRTSELEKSTTELATFLYHSSHDVQAPIATLKGLQSLAIQETKEHLTKEYLTLIKNTLSKLERMVKTIQQVHHIKTNKPIIQKIDISEAIQEIIDSHQKESNVTVKLELPGELFFHADLALTKISLNELLRNSIQYNEGNTNLIIKIKGYCTDHESVLIIEDNGVGISAAAKKELFTMFKRGNEKSTGIGLGLYIAQICIERMGGRIIATEPAQQGARFQVSIPYAS